MTRMMTMIMRMIWKVSSIFVLEIAQRRRGLALGLD